MSDRFEQAQKEEFNWFFQHAEVSDNRALRIEFDTLRAFVGDLAGKRALDLRRGVGRNGISLAAYASEVVGYDMSEVAIEKVNQIAREVGARNFSAGYNDFCDIAPASFDVVFCANMLHHTPSPAAVCARWGASSSPAAKSSSWRTTR